ncbi:type I polyketide synthase [Aspergillus stella-maris]|uniref:type I polyketide synthase n=1 Tax=Aspergillus stella-maris TaxID=1810926 RepID=UPI003CCE02FF
MHSTCAETPATEPIAIVGFSCKFAGEASTPEGFWQMLAAGRSAWTKIPESRFKLEGSYHEKGDHLSSLNVRGGHFLEQDLSAFDAQFFNLSAEAAKTLDPQIRIQLETTYEALENGGITLPEIAGTSTSVYAAVHTRDYREGMIRDEDNLPRLLPTGTGDAMFSNRISHFYDLRGPSFTLDTGCSGGMVALHQGIQSLRTGESNMAITCGALLSLNPDMFKLLSSLGFTSPDGKCYAFDSRANGYGRGEGVAAIILKRLSDAIEDGDIIRAVIRESGLNQDGRTETITTPSGSAQAALIQNCYRRAGLDPLDTQYCEAHGTGTMAGDPVECGALATVFQRNRPPDNPLRIGSVKTNIGHTESASGLAALIKVVLAMENGKIPPSINFEKPNPKLPLHDWRLRVVTELEDWPLGPGGVRRASVNNFGYGGTNGHLIVESAPDLSSAQQVNGFANGHAMPDSQLNTQLLVFSAQSEQSCRDTLENVKEYMRRIAPDDGKEALDSLIYTLGQRRTRFPWVIAHPLPIQEGSQVALSNLDSTELSPQRTVSSPRVGMVFTGQGAQWYAMGRELIATYPVFWASLHEADTYIKLLGAKWSMVDELHQKQSVSRVDEVDFSTVLCVAMQISLVRLLESWGVTPVAVASHSSGEIAAAYAAGGLSYQSAMAVAYYRGVLVAKATLNGSLKGGMIAIGLGVKETRDLLAQVHRENGFVDIACINSPSSTTVSGDEKVLIKVEELAKEQRVVARRVKVQTAFHSHHMKFVEDAYLEALRGRLAPADPDEGKGYVAFSSPVTGRRLPQLHPLSDPHHWADSLLQPVQFVNAFTDMVIGGSENSNFNVDVIIEVGPHKALGFPIKEILAEPQFSSPKPAYLSCLVRDKSAVETMHSLAASLITHGLQVDMNAVNFPHGKSPSVQVLSDLPSYPWNHQSRHWCEPRFNRALRERSQLPHSLLGSLVLGTDLNSPSWRKIIRISEAPWLAEHVVQNNILFPAAGYISLAIEAIKQLSVLQANNDQSVSGYSLRAVSIMQALVIPGADDGVEIQTSLHNVSEKAIGRQGWKEFEIRSVTSQSHWTFHARGLIMIEHEESPEKTIPEPCPVPLSGYTRQFEGSDLYAKLRETGLAHGKSFQGITKVEQAGDNRRADSLLSIPFYTSSGSDLSNEVLIHPTTLDAVVHTAWGPFLGVTGYDNGLVPRSIGSLWLSGAISQTPGHQFKVFTSMGHADARSWRASIAVADLRGISTAPVMQIKDLMLQSLGSNMTIGQVDRSWEKEPCFKFYWAPDFSLMGNRAHGSIQHQLSHPPDAEEIQIQLDLRRVCCYYMSDALACLTSEDLQQLQSHHVKLRTWMQHQLQLAAEGLLGSDSASWLNDTPQQRQALIAKVHSASMNGELVCHVGPLLSSILRQERAPLEVLMEEDRLSRYYCNGLKIERATSQAAGVLQNLIHKNPGARILEVGGGTGGLTRHVLPKIGTAKAGGALAELYHFTDVSTAFFDKAQEQFSAWGDIMRFDKFDAEADPASQGFELGSYDIVIAAQVLHATKSMSRTMSHVRQLMKPGATLLLLETTQDALDSHFIFGLLPGWWLGEESERALTPSLSIDLWDSTLRSTGFSGVDFDVRDCESDEWCQMSIMTTTAGPLPQPVIERSDQIVLVTRQLSYNDQRWVRALEASLGLSGQMPTRVEFGTATAESFKGKWVVFLGEIEKPLLYSLDAAGLERLQTMIKHCRGLLWVTRGGAVNCERPELSLAPGFLRSIRQEYAGRKYITLDLDPNSNWSEASVEAILQVLTTSFGTTGGDIVKAPPYEFEYAERDGVILIPRLFRDTSRNQNLFPKAVDWSAPVSLPTEPLFQRDRPLALTVGVPGLLDTLVYDDDPRIPTEEARFPLDYIEIEPHAYGVNFRDVLVAMGQLDRRVMGVEGAGVITRVGSRAAAHGYAVGDNVFALLPGGFGSRARVEWTSAMHMPPDMSFEEAASVPSVFTTSYLCLYTVARLQRGQTVLIHAGAGGVGQSAIQLAQHIGAEVYTTVGSPEKRALLKERYGIPDDHIFSSRDRSFAKAILEATNGVGVDVVLNSLSGPLLQESLNIVAPFGHFIEIGKRDIEQNNHLEMKPFARQITFSSFDLYALYQHQKNVVHSALAEIGRLLEENVISSIYPVTTYALNDIAKAFRQLQAGKHSGKLVLSISPQQKVRVLPRQSTAKLRPDASYVLVGGAGGIGRSIAHWLASRGARNLVVLSRSAETNSAAVSLDSELQPKGCRVKLISCDASNEHALSEALKICAEELPPIRGVVQGAMVLQDSVLEHMSFGDYQTAINPKVKASWNLHSQLSSSELDFFIFLSSMSGVYGLPSQSNYSAGNAYEDGLARWRVSQGLPAVSIDLGPVKGVGYVAGTRGVAERLTKLGHYPVTEEQVLRVIESAVLSPFEKQIAVGVNQGPGPHWQTDGAISLGRDARFRALKYRQPFQGQGQGQPSSQSNAGSTRATAPLAARITAASSRQDVENLVTEAITTKLAAIFMIPAADIDPAKHLSAYGLDSLGAVELRNMIALQLAAEVSIFAIMQSESLAGLAIEVARKSTHVDAALFDG